MGAQPTKAGSPQAASNRRQLVFQVCSLYNFPSKSVTEEWVLRFDSDSSVGYVLPTRGVQSIPVTRIADRLKCQICRVRADSYFYREPEAEQTANSSPTAKRSARSAKAFPALDSSADALPESSGRIDLGEGSDVTVVMELDLDINYIDAHHMGLIYREWIGFPSDEVSSAASPSSTAAAAAAAATQPSKLIDDNPGSGNGVSLAHALTAGSRPDIPKMIVSIQLPSSPAKISDLSIGKFSAGRSERTCGMAGQHPADAKNSSYLMKILAKWAENQEAAARSLQDAYESLKEVSQIQQKNRNLQDLIIERDQEIQSLRAQLERANEAARRASAGSERASSLSLFSRTSVVKGKTQQNKPNGKAAGGYLDDFADKYKDEDRAARSSGTQKGPAPSGTFDSEHGQDVPAVAGPKSDSDALSNPEVGTGVQLLTGGSFGSFNLMSHIRAHHAKGQSQGQVNGAAATADNGTAAQNGSAR
ncbi:unnamed protein product [Vitrella brassicaformis CCMP3155]|uniref:Uncharacterized protein n=2 Tax=Vitrella brassicaformis TaxID=1169539 RepID=A0A0G4E847_VITBC|nr:unnamed protein product [Vitrella brassicaformis CCMP3155]|mmetsp:Transcript_11239/g.27197  ORF Transcript_11239/g.27197 Transcript_11239/m.27197 type:complete len:476 (+) Transcript_11239:3-1430(+)|eukprot:CEL91603.1 unnamed protein product [Vitrella brassicaformis CCMP3155]